ncbi:hypothetical protein GZH79_04040 [Loktanella sp. SALINAS62]|nr:hypothetical protein [Loktanella sp. SALINAS62]
MSPHVVDAMKQSFDLSSYFGAADRERVALFCMVNHRRSTNLFEQNLEAVCDIVCIGQLFRLKQDMQWYPADLIDGISERWWQLQADLGKRNA